MKRKKDLANEVRLDYLKRKEARREIEAKWFLNIDFYNGNQYSEILPDGEIRDVGRDYYWQSREVYNHVAPIVDTRLAKFSGEGSHVTVRPATSDFSDVNAAKFATLLLQSVEEENSFKKLVNKATFWSEICGTSFYKVCWSNKKGSQIAADLMDGDVEITVCPPYEIYPDNLGANDVDECLSIIHARAYPVEAIEENWGVKVKGEDVDVINSSYIYGNRVTERRKDYAVVIERYEKPSKDFPEGRLVVVAGENVLYEGKLPYLNGENGERGFPFIRQICLEKPASFFGSSIIERIIPVQRAFNAVKCRKHEYMNRMAMGVLMVEDGSVDTDDLMDEGLAPGKVITYRQGSNLPVMLNMGGVPNEFSVEEDSLLSEFINISGVSDFLTASSIRGNNLSGVALNLIIEQDNNRMSVTVTSIRRATVEVGKHIIRLYRQFAAMGKLKRICGENGEMEMRSFKGSELNSDDIVYDVENENLNSSANRKSMAEELVRLGLFNDKDGKISDNNRLKLLEIMGFGNWEQALSIEELHIRKANRENTEVNNKAPEVGEEDNHTLHIQEHTRYLIGGDNDLTETGRKALSEHIRKHRVFNRLLNEAEKLN